MSEFKKGDRVVCVDASNCDELTDGQIYVVMGTSTRGGTIILFDDDSSSGEFLSYRFVLVESAQPKRFIAGDKVVCVRADDSNGFLVAGKVYVVGQDQELAVTRLVYIIGEDGYSTTWYANRFVPAPTEAVPPEQPKLYRRTDGRGADKTFTAKEETQIRVTADGSTNGGHLWSPTRFAECFEEIPPAPVYEIRDSFMFDVFKDGKHTGASFTNRDKAEKYVARKKAQES